MTESGYSNLLHAEINGVTLRPSGNARKLVSGWVDLGAGVPGAFQLVFRDDEKTVLKDTKAIIGSKVMIAAVSDGQGAQSPLITGEITGLETDYDRTGTFTIIRGYDLGHRMLRQYRVKSWEKQTAADIARKIAAENNIPIDSVESTRTVYQFITQANVTDWDFLCRLADENGMVMSLSPKGGFRFVKPKSAAGAPPLSTPSDKSTKVLDGHVDVLRCRVAVTSADQVTRAEARGWNVKTKKEVVGRSTADDFPGIEIGTSPVAAVSAFGYATRVETDVPYDEVREVDNAAKALADDITGSFAEVEVTTRGNPTLRPGVPVTLSDVGEPFAGKYTVTAARHNFGDGEHYECLLNVSGRQWRSLYGLASGGSGPTTHLPGVVIAKVSDTKDPLNQGRVKLEFPWLDGTYTSDWTRTVQFGGVKGSSLIGPDPDDEVLVAFDRGALDHPYVIGGLYNGVDKPRVEAGVESSFDKTTGKALRHTLGDRRGNRVVLLDHWIGQKEGVLLSTGDDKLTINMDSVQTEITVDSKGKVTIKADGPVTVEGKTSVSVSAGTNLSLSAKGKLSLKAGTDLTLDATAINTTALSFMSLKAPTISVFGQAALSLTAGAALSIKGATVPILGATTIDGMLPVTIPVG